MLPQPATASLQEYLESSSVIDCHHPQITAVATALRLEARSLTELAQNTYQYVRDCISHSADIIPKTVTCAASQVLQAQEGLCYAKAHLLAALLRCNGIPAGFCYQLLRSPTLPGNPLVLHGLNGVFLQEHSKWIRLDARGNKPGIQAQFSVTHEYLAYPVNEETGEKLYPQVYPSPAPAVLHALTECSTFPEIWHNLPGELVSQ